MNATPLESVVSIGIAFIRDQRTLPTLMDGPVGQMFNVQWSVDPWLLFYSGPDIKIQGCPVLSNSKCTFL